MYRNWHRFRYNSKMSVSKLVTLTAIICTIQNIRGTLSSAFSLDIPKLNSIFSTRESELSDAELDFTQLAAKYGHPAEEHLVYTEDGYRLKVFHLPGKGNGLPVLLFHGFADSSDTWIIRGNGSLAITLANAGYDVWLGNVRGNKHSQGHLSLNLDTNPKYWNFTFHEHGVYDLPTTIDLVLNKTGASRLNAIGHSQGTTIFFVLLSTKPEYNRKVNLFIALAPVAYLENSPPPLGILLRSLPVLYDILRLIHKYEVFGDTSPEHAFIRIACSTPLSAYAVCQEGISSKLTGDDPTEMEPDFSLVAFQHFPTAASTKNALHFGQVTIRGSFARFDYGTEGNLVAYDTDAPPEYDLSKVISKIVLLTATNDYFSTQADVALLRRQLPNVVKFVVNPRPQTNHLDYVWGKNMGTYIFPYIFDSLKEYGR